MNYVTLDPASFKTGHLGVTVWWGRSPIEVGTIRAAGKSGVAYWENGKAKTKVYKSWPAALVAQLHLARGLPVIVEAAFSAPKHPGAGLALSHAIGYVQALVESHRAEFFLVTNGEWKAAAKDEWGITWPRNRDKAKALAARIASQKFGFDDVAVDCSDSLCMGPWVWRSKVVV